jgi:ribosomal protein S19
MSRALWKGPIIYSNTAVSRNITVTPELIKKTVQIHDGKNFITVNLDSSNLGKKFGILVPSKKFKSLSSFKKSTKYSTKSTKNSIKSSNKSPIKN